MLTYVYILDTSLPFTAETVIKRHPTMPQHDLDQSEEGSPYKHPTAVLLQTPTPTLAMSVYVLPGGGSESQQTLTRQLHVLRRAHNMV